MKQYQKPAILKRRTIVQSARMCCGMTGSGGCGKLIVQAVC